MDLNKTHFPLKNALEWNNKAWYLNKGIHVHFFRNKINISEYRKQALCICVDMKLYICVHL